MPIDKIVVKGARVHNLKNINVYIPRDKLTVVSGVSGSGKSTLAFDTIHAEGQRRYVESLSAYARQFLGLMDKPDVDFIEGLSPTIAIDQKSISKSPRSTVGTMTEIYDYLRLLYSTIGKPYCPEDGTPIRRQSIDEMVQEITHKFKNDKVLLYAPVVRGRKGEYRKLLENMLKQGLTKARVNGELINLEEGAPSLDRYKFHHIEILVDRVIVKEDDFSRLIDSLEIALKLGDGLVLVESDSGGSVLMSEKFSCPVCGFRYKEILPRLFSFNSPYGACPDCTGLGYKMEISKDLIIPDMELSIPEGAFEPLAFSNYYTSVLGNVVKHYGFNPEKPLSSYPPKVIQALLYGTNGEKIQLSYTDELGLKHTYFNTFEGAIPLLLRRYRGTTSDNVRDDISKYMLETPCKLCEGRKLKKEALSIYVGDLNIYEITCLTVDGAIKYIHNLSLSPRDDLIAGQVIKEIKSRLKFLQDVGLNYLTLNRLSGTLSGGEAQRLRLATQVGSSLVGVTYLLDEPSIGLHPRDNYRLLKTLFKLRDTGNTVVVVEHDEETIKSADYIVDLGPLAGVRGGNVVFQGLIDEFINKSSSLTAKYLRGEENIPVPEKRNNVSGYISLQGASKHNLKNISLKIPLGLLTAITGVSGSGKSTLLYEVIYKGIQYTLGRNKIKPEGLSGVYLNQDVERVLLVDQSPIGRTPRSNPATYIGIFDYIRKFFSELPDSKIRGYRPGRFSFNVKGGRCEACRGDGFTRVEMHFLPDVHVPCDVCGGKRYNSETIEVNYKGYSISDVLSLTVDEAVKLFSFSPPITRGLSFLQEIGLGYLQLGQPAPTLSGGEAQRVKLSTELQKRSNSNTVFLLDEPTVGLHYLDVDNLLKALHRLVDNGNTVIIVEHNLDIIKNADYVIDLGPEGGEEGGFLVAQGSPEDIILNPASYTGIYLKKVLCQKKAVSTNA